MVAPHIAPNNRVKCDARTSEHIGGRVYIFHIYRYPLRARDPINNDVEQNSI